MRIGYWVMTLLLFICRVAHAEGTSAVLMVKVAEHDQGKVTEARFVTELRLSIEGFAVQEIPAPDPSFVDIPLARQIALIRPLMGQRKAVAAMWLHPVSDDVLLLQVVVLDTGRALVRLFEQDLVAGSESALAATAAELLGTAYLFESDTASQPPEVKALVNATRAQAKVPDSAPSTWRLQVAGEGSGGFVDKVGADVRVGAGVGVERDLGALWVLTLGLNGFFGPFGQWRGSTVKGYEVAGRLDLFVGPRLGRLHMGPMVRLSGGPAGVMVTRSGYPRHDYTQWGVRVGVGVEARVRIGEATQLTAVSGLSFSPIRLEVRRRADDDTLYRSGMLGGWGSIGVVFY